MTEALRWEAASFVETADAGGLAVDLDGVSVTMLSLGDDFLLSWSMKVRRATLPDVEAIAIRGARVLREMLDRDFDVEWNPEG